MALRRCSACGTKHLASTMCPACCGSVAQAQPNDPRDAQIRELQAQVRTLTEERDELQQLFDLQHTRTLEADAEYIAAHPRETLYTPDLGELIRWLREDRDRLRAEVERLQIVIDGACCELGAFCPDMATHFRTQAEGGVT